MLELTPIQMWNTDLDKFLEAWDVSIADLFTTLVLTLRQASYTDWESKAIEPGTVAKKGKRKQATLAAMMRKAAKKVGSDDDDDDYDFKPKAKTKKPE